MLLLCYNRCVTITAILVAGQKKSKEVIAKMAQKVTESVKGMDQKAETVAEVGKGLEGSAFQSSVSRGLLRGRKVRVSLVSTDAGG